MPTKNNDIGGRVCARCGKIGNQKTIHVHHKNMNHDDNNCENLIYLCARCHMQFHAGHWNYTTDNLVSSHIPKNVVDILLEDRRIVIPDKVYLALEDMAANERKKVKDEVIKAMITPKSLAQHIIANAVKRAVRP